MLHNNHSRRRVSRALFMPGGKGRFPGFKFRSTKRVWTMAIFPAVIIIFTRDFLSFPGDILVMPQDTDTSFKVLLDTLLVAV